MVFELLTPSLDLVPAYRVALQRGYSPDDVRGPDATVQSLNEIDANAAGYIRSLHHEQGRTALSERSLPVTVVRWMWDGDFAGSIGLRWQAGAAACPDNALGNVAVSVVPWRRHRGYATRALALMCAEARSVGMTQVVITTLEENVASRRVIEKNGGVIVGSFERPGTYGRDGKPSLRYMIDLCNDGRTHTSSLQSAYEHAR